MSLCCILSNTQVCLLHWMLLAIVAASHVPSWSRFDCKESVTGIMFLWTREGFDTIWLCLYRSAQSSFIHLSDSPLSFISSFQAGYLSVLLLVHAWRLSQSVCSWIKRWKVHCCSWTSEHLTDGSVSTTKRVVVWSQVNKLESAGTQCAEPAPFFKYHLHMTYHNVWRSGTSWIF